jgi:hypothetical protein
MFFSGKIPGQLWTCEIRQAMCFKMQWWDQHGTAIPTSTEENRKKEMVIGFSEAQNLQGTSWDFGSFNSLCLDKLPSGPTRGQHHPHVCRWGSANQGDLDSGPLCVVLRTSLRILPLRSTGLWSQGIRPVVWDAGTYDLWIAFSHTGSIHQWGAVWLPKMSLVSVVLS